jgi:hypothetical protein
MFPWQQENTTVMKDTYSTPSTLRYYKQDQLAVAVAVAVAVRGLLECSHYEMFLLKAATKQRH